VLVSHLKRSRESALSLSFGALAALPLALYCQEQLYSRKISSALRSCLASRKKNHSLHLFFFYEPLFTMPNAPPNLPEGFGQAPYCDGIFAGVIQMPVTLNAAEGWLIASVRNLARAYGRPEADLVTGQAGTTRLVLVDWILANRAGPDARFLAFTA
jgi:hypothetical protein